MAAAQAHEGRRPQALRARSVSPLLYGGGHPPGASIASSIRMEW